RADAPVTSVFVRDDVAGLADGGDVAGIAEALGDGLLLGCTPLDLEEAARAARALGVPLLVQGAEPPAGLRGYTLDPTAPVFALRRFGAWLDESAEPSEDAAGEAGGREEP
ncbi:MAG TPA: hypothetical protein VHI93_06680, partial [Candidatus Thermoplasmatota archaeon]|nr:hypothetical protein [Candidatus Thermoplasmatota archaeon]